ncbi:hypothetical protein EYR40_009730 [Pleurotus pulmonarius]|nr:hypothetical protein EYR40_009730 [Pleurotus pulmonarius]
MTGVPRSVGIKELAKNINIKGLPSAQQNLPQSRSTKVKAQRSDNVLTYDSTPLTPSAFSPSQIPESSSAQSATMANHSCDRPVLQSAQYPVHYRCPSSQGATVPVDPAQRPGLPICRHTATEQSGSTHVNNSSGTLNRVGGDQRVNANNVRTLLNCEGTTVQLVVVSGAMLGDVGTTDEVPSPQGYGAGGGESNPNSRTDNQRLEDLRSDVEWMMDELQNMRDPESESLYFGDRAASEE